MKAWQPEFEMVFNQEVTCGVVRPQSDGVFRYRTKTIKSGPYLESEVFPIWATRTETRIAREQVTRAAQQRLNERNALRKLTRLINCNFGDRDLGVTLTYKGEAPGMQEAQRDIRNYIRRLRDWRNKRGLEPLKYIYVVEGLTEDAAVEHQLMLGSGSEAFQTNTDQKSKRVHHHLVINAMDRDVVEALWGKGFANCKRLQPDEFGLEALARYMIKERGKSRKQNQAGEGQSKAVCLSKRWYGSRNLKQPTVTVSDWKLSRRKVEKLVEGIADGPGTVFNHAYPGYQFVDLQIRSSEFVSGFYLYARMCRSRGRSEAFINRRI